MAEGEEGDPKVKIKRTCKKAYTGAKDLDPIYCLPYVYLAGVHKSGTSDLFHSLLQHPHIFSSRKEIEFWAKRVLGKLLINPSSARHDCSRFNMFFSR